MAANRPEMASAATNLSGSSPAHQPAFSPVSWGYSKVELPGDAGRTGPVVALVKSLVQKLIGQVDVCWFAVSIDGLFAVAQAFVKGDIGDAQAPNINCAQCVSTRDAALLIK